MMRNPVRRLFIVAAVSLSIVAPLDCFGLSIEPADPEKTPEADL
jgi:hypothetical protein